MTSFDDREYATLIENLLHDIHYINTSNMGKIGLLRRHTEVMVRKLLDIGNSEELVLGQIRMKSQNDAVMKGMGALGDELSAKLIEIVDCIRPLGNEGTHTKHTADFSDSDVAGFEDAILDLYALIFIRFFIDFQVGLFSSPLVLNAFSFLPPIIRYKTWSYLFKRDSQNIQIANRLCLSIIKAFDKERAYKWLDDNHEAIRAIPYPTDYERYQYVLTAGIEIEPGSGVYMVSLAFDDYENTLDLLHSKIADERTSINESGKMYATFEEALQYYRGYKINHFAANTKELEELYSLMDFVFLGRKSAAEL
jgi:hypothetical protein